LLLASGANIAARDQDGKTALIFAAHNRKTDTMEFLLKKGVPVDDRTYDGETALMRAAFFGSANNVRLLLQKGADIEAKNKDGETALILAAKAGYVESARVLLDAGANIAARQKDGETPLMMAVCSHVYYLSSAAGQVEVVKLLVDKGAEIGAQDNKGETALTCADRTKFPQAASALDSMIRQRKLIEQSASMAPKERFALYLSVFKENPSDDVLRGKIIQIAAALPEPPAIPEEARQLFVLATTQIKQASTPGALDQPIALLRKATALAPWWGNAYYNLSRALEMRGQYDDAIQQLKYYLELKPAEADAREAQAHIVVIQTEKEAAAHKQP
jgi:tetratricopeptide (TPR) repeat protein